MIGGIDLTLSCDDPDRALRSALAVLSKQWKQCIIEDAVTATDLSPIEISKIPLPAELLVYCDESSQQSWQNDGATPENCNRMVHLIRGDAGLTVVVDDPNTSEMRALLNEIQESLRRAAA